MEQIISNIRSFNRFYTSHIGLLNQQFLDSPYSLTEVRILYEIGAHGKITAQQICELLNLDKGYVSRLLNSFLKKGIIQKMKCEDDARSLIITLSEKGHQLLQELQTKSDKQIESFEKKLGTEEKSMLVNSMRTIQNLLSKDYNNGMLAKEVTFREGLQPGDIGYLIYLHGLLYARESGYSLQFEGYVAKTFYDFLGNYSAAHDRVWLAEYNQQIIGCIAIVHHDSEEAQLRWFLTHPIFRGTGIGKHLLNVALEYCREKKYSNIFLLTTNIQERAISMYKKAGFVQTNAIESTQWGKPLYEERFDLKII
ncbi:Protease synthase and sporulation negative regulatory protein PAI 1 [compost metagenome]